MFAASRLLAFSLVASAATAPLCSCSPSGGSQGNQAAAAAPLAASSPAAKITPPPVGAAKPVDYPGLPNVVTYHDGFICGGVPEGKAGFDTLAAMGVKTIISVDGSVPDIAEAKAHGMRYVHLPFGYNGFDEPRELEMAQAVERFEGGGPIYIHCHHGKHRSASAAGTVSVCMGWMDNAEAAQLMKVSGTAPNYTGLYKCTADAKPLTPAQLSAAPANFPEVTRPNGFVESMVAIDETNDRLKAIEKHGWKAPADHPDLAPVAEAAQLESLFRVLGETERAKPKAGKGEIATLLGQAGERAQGLEDMLAKGEPDPAKLSAQFALIASSCKNCHAKYRD